MSMLTLQAKRLRETANELCQYGTHFGYDVTRDPLMRDAARQMVDAADIIENLRGRSTEGLTCHNVAQHREDLVCSVCGCYVENIELDWSYCPSCGRLVVG